MRWVFHANHVVEAVIEQWMSWSKAKYVQDICHSRFSTYTSVHIHTEVYTYVHRCTHMYRDVYIVSKMTVETEECTHLYAGSLGRLTLVTKPINFSSFEPESLLLSEYHLQKLYLFYYVHVYHFSVSICWSCFPISSPFKCLLLSIVGTLSPPTECFVSQNICCVRGVTSPYTLLDLILT